MASPVIRAFDVGCLLVPLARSVGWAIKRIIVSLRGLGGTRIFTEKLTTYFVFFPSYIYGARRNLGGEGGRRNPLSPAPCLQGAHVFNWLER